MYRISVLFSEPKIPQFNQIGVSRRRPKYFSALQRAENSSIKPNLPTDRRREHFSALQRAENSSIDVYESLADFLLNFSALQRAENSSIAAGAAGAAGAGAFQCSSASRKFLNRAAPTRG